MRAFVLALCCTAALACQGGGEPSAVQSDASVEVSDDSAIDTRPSPRPDVRPDTRCECPPESEYSKQNLQPCTCSGQICGDCHKLSCVDDRWVESRCVKYLGVGEACVDDTECDATGAGVNACSNSLFTIGTVNPTPVCVGKSCDPGDGSTINGCAGDRGVCLRTSSSGICLGACDFRNDGAAPTGCAGKDRCNLLGWGYDTAGALGGVGYCFGGCRVDADCTKGDVCQVETSYCVKKHLAFTKPLGTPCTKADVSSDDGCNCALTDPTQGYCTRACVVGIDTCPTGFSCDAQVPLADEAGGTLFSKVPAGIAARCLKNCDADADCAAFGPSKCVENVGVGRKTCQAVLAR